MHCLKEKKHPVNNKYTQKRTALYTKFYISDSWFLVFRMSQGYKKRTLDQAVIFPMICSSDNEVSTLAVSDQTK